MTEAQKTDLRERMALLDSCIEAWFDDSINALVSDGASFFNQAPEDYKADCREAMQRVLAIARPAHIEECAALLESHAETYHDQMVIALVRKLAEKP